jgi:hypothetical protein
MSREERQMSEAARRAATKLVTSVYKRWPRPLIGNMQELEIEAVAKLIDEAFAEPAGELFPSSALKCQI